MKYLRILFSAAALLLAASCIENDIPYPTIELNIRSIEGEGFTVAGISLVNRTVTLTLDEKTDIRKVTIDKAEFDVATSNPMMTDKEKFISQIRTSQPLSGEFDLRAPLYVTLSLYQDYEWTIVAEQPIARSFTVAGQIGSTLIDTQARTATAYVAEGTDLKAVTVTSLKLGPADITAYSPTAEELSATGFETVRLVDVTCHGRTERWMLHVQPTNVKIGVREIDLWNNTAVVTTMVTPEDYATAEIQYRLKGTADWQTTQKGAQDESGIFTSSIAPEWTSLTNDAGIPVKRLVTTKGVYAGQTYEFRLLVGGQQTETAEYTAPAGDTIPDGNMENPGLSCFTSENTNAEFWASGNNTFADKLCRQGLSTEWAAAIARNWPRQPLPSSTSQRQPDVRHLLQRRPVDGRSRIRTALQLDGAPLPGMKVKYHATLGTIDASKHSGAPVGIGDPDKARIFVAIIDWNARHRVASGTKDPTGIWDPAETTQTAEGKLIAYGSLFVDKSTEGEQMVEATLPLNFYDPAAGRPTGKYSIIISCSTSAYGDYMVGCTTNVMYVDDFQWVY